MTSRNGKVRDRARTRSPGRLPPQLEKCDSDQNIPRRIPRSRSSKHERNYSDGYHRQGEDAQQKKLEKRNTMEAWSWLKSSFKWLAAIASVILATCFYFGFCWRNKLGLNPCGLPTLDLAPNLESESELLLLAECAIPARKISFEEVHQLDECWTMQLALAHAACAKKHDMLRDLYYSFEVAVIIGAIIIVLWLCCYIELLPYTILRLAYTYLENLGIITFFEAGLKKAAAGLLFGVAVCVLVHCTLMPALVLHMNLKYLCDQLLKEQKDFYKALQEAAIFQVYERTFTCELLPHYILFARAAWGQAVWSVVAAPLIPVIWEACKKLMQQEREWRKHQERYSRLINFSLNMVVENQEQGKHHSKRRRPMRTFMFRTFCELPTKDLIHNTALRASLKEAAQCTEGQFPLLHVLTPPAIEDLNRMCLNTISQRIGTTFFAMDQSPSGFPQDATCGDYCFGNLI